MKTQAVLTFLVSVAYIKGLQAGQIGPQAIINPVVENFSGLGLPFDNTGPLVLNGVTYTTDTGTFRYANWGRDPIFFGIGTDSAFGFIDVVFDAPVLRAGGWVGASGGPVEFFDQSDKLLGTVSLLLGGVMLSGTSGRGRFLGRSWWLGYGVPSPEFYPQARRRCG